MKEIVFSLLSVDDAFGVSLRVFSEAEEASEYVADARHTESHLEAGLLLALKRLRAQGWAISGEDIGQVSEQLARFRAFLDELPEQIRQANINPLFRANLQKEASDAN